MYIHVSVDFVLLSFYNLGQCEGLLAWNGATKTVPRFFVFPCDTLL